MKLGPLVAEARWPWSTKRRKHREVLLRARLHGRGRWRWWALLLHWPRDTTERGGKTISVTLEAKSYLTDESMRGNLRHKTFARIGIKLGAGGVPERNGRCPVMNSKGRRCTWEREHVPMVIRWRVPARQAATGGAEFAHSWAVPAISPAEYDVVQEPRRSLRDLWRGGGTMVRRR